jgi:hypothetical protein
MYFVSLFSFAWVERMISVVLISDSSQRSSIHHQFVVESQGGRLAG